MAPDDGTSEDNQKPPIPQLPASNLAPAFLALPTKVGKRIELPNTWDIPTHLP